MKVKVLLILALITLSNCGWTLDFNCKSRGFLGFLGCLGCYSGFFINPTGKCAPTQIGARCATYAMKSGNCLTCPSGSTLMTGVCVPSTATSDTYVQNPNCKTSDSATAACTSCWTNFYLSSGKCVMGDPLCATFDNSGTGACGSCFGSAFYLDSTGKCIAGSGNCATYTSTGTCATCWPSSPFYINEKGNCVLVSSTCRTWVSNGNCLTCWRGKPNGRTC
jgi:hypothetical protein